MNRGLRFRNKDNPGFNDKNNNLRFNNKNTLTPRENLKDGK
jgi:hypothetical protein